MESFSFDRFDCPCHPLEAMKKPYVIVRCVTLVLACIAFSCIVTNGWNEKNVCQFNKDAGACSFAFTVSLSAIIVSEIFLLIDIALENRQFSNPWIKRIPLIIDTFLCILWGILWFVCFCYLADSWRKTKSVDVTGGWNSLRAAIVFSFFSILIYAVMIGLSVTRLRQMSAELDDFMVGYHDSSSIIHSSQTAYTSLPSGPTPNTYESIEPTENVEPSQPPVAGYQEATNY